MIFTVFNLSHLWKEAFIDSFFISTNSYGYLLYPRHYYSWDKAFGNLTAHCVNQGSRP